MKIQKQEKRDKPFPARIKRSLFEKVEKKRKIKGDRWVDIAETMLNVYLEEK